MRVVIHEVIGNLLSCIAGRGSVRAGQEVRGQRMERGSESVGAKGRDVVYMYM